MSCLRRTAKKAEFEKRFTSMMGRFNDGINRFADYEPRIWVKNVEGFDCHEDGRAMKVEDWSPDGAHPGTNIKHRSFRKYLGEVRAALYNAYPKVKD